MQGMRSDPLYELTEADCWALLERGALGRLAVAVGDLVDVFPVNYAVSDGRILFRTNEGTKLAALTINRHVAFEVDGVDEQTAWSVVVKGVARAIEGFDEEADALPLVSWLPTPKTQVVRIEASEISGRGFVRGAEPETDWY